MIRRAFLPALVLALFAVPSARAQVKLEYKFPEESKSSYKLNAKLDQVLTIMGQDVKTKSDRSVVTSTSIGKRNADGTLPLTIKMDSLRAEITLPGDMVVSFDSANPDAKVENEQLAFLADVFRAVAGIQYTVVLDSKNKVKFVEGTEAIQAKIDALQENAAQALRGMMNADKLKRSFEQDHNDLPDVLARKGEPWERTETTEIGGGQTLTFQKRYEYVGTVEQGGKTLDKITYKALSVKYDMDPNAGGAAKVTKSDLKIDSSEGSFLFDRELGNTVETKETTRIKGDMTLVIQDQELPSTLDLILDTSSRREPASK